ncbi:MAG: hypothetical protein RSA96_02340 [Erysipelotrichaceae bacterium]
MAALVCDICGGKLSMGTGGIAVCDSCGLEHTKERMREKVQEIKGTVRVDNSHLIENYYTLAENAYAADNKAEAEMYCNKIIEIDINHYNAWLIKAKSAGWQSTIVNNRLNEAANCFAKAIDLASEDVVDDIKTQATDEMKNLSLALILLRGDRFSQYPDEKEALGFFSDIEEILSSVMTLANRTGTVTTGFMEEIGSIISRSVIDAWDSIIEPDYSGNDDRPDEYECQKFVDRLWNCIMLIEKSINLSDNDDENVIFLYNYLIFFHKRIINSCSWKNEYDSFWQTWQWKEKDFLSEDAKASHYEMISEYSNIISELENKIDETIEKEKIEKEEIEKKAIEQRFIEYWNSHLNEKLSMEKEKNLLLQKITFLNAEIKKNTNNQRKDFLEQKIFNLNIQKSSLGLFKSKEKKVMQEQINALSSDLKLTEIEINNTRSKISNEIRSLQTSLSEIENELSKDR